MKKKRPPLPSEKRDGDFASKFGNTEFEKKVRTKTGEDGVEETHIDYKLRKKKLYFIP